MSQSQQPVVQQQKDLCKCLLCSNLQRSCARSNACVTTSVLIRPPEAMLTMTQMFLRCKGQSLVTLLVEGQGLVPCTTPCGGTTASPLYHSLWRDKDQSPVPLLVEGTALVLHISKLIMSWNASLVGCYLRLLVVTLTQSMLTIWQNSMLTIWQNMCVQQGRLWLQASRTVLSPPRAP